MPLTLPYTISPRDKILSVPLQANFQAIVDKFSGGIMDADCSVAMGLSGAKVAVNSMPGDRIASGTITKTQMGTGSVAAAQIEALAVTKDKLTVTAGQKITKTQLDLAVLTGTVGYSIGGSNIGFSYWATVQQQVVGGVNSWIVRAYQAVRDNSTGAVTGNSQQLLVPVAAIPVATTTPIAVILKNPTFAAGGGQIDVEFYYLTNS